MKKTLLLIFIGLLTFSLQSRAQSTAPDVDPRIYQHYTQQEVNDMLANAPAKIKMLNIYYRSSFVMIQGANQVTPLDPNTVDVTNYEHLRKDNVRVRVGHSRITGEVVELLSKQELQALYDSAE
jgi:hypothetical protein